MEATVTKKIKELQRIHFECSFGAFISALAISLIVIICLYAYDVKKGFSFVCSIGSFILIFTIALFIGLTIWRIKTEKLLAFWEKFSDGLLSDAAIVELREKLTECDREIIKHQSALVACEMTRWRLIKEVETHAL